MKISVLIATRNRPQLLVLCVYSLLRNTRPPDEIIIIDQSDDVATQLALKKLQRKEIRYEKTPPLGKSNALNLAVSMTSADFLAFTDDDVQVDERWLETLIALAAKHPGADAFCGKVLPENNTDPKDYLNLVLGNTLKWIDRKTNPLNSGFCGANIFVRHSALVRVGGFHKSFGPGALFKNNDDGELAYRLVQAGAPILYSPDLIVYHSGWRRESDNRRLKSNYAFGLGAFAGYYLKRGDSTPFRHLAVKSTLKLRRMIIGMIILHKERIIDGYLHLKGFFLGFIKGLLEESPQPPLQGGE